MGGAPHGDRCRAAVPQRSGRVPGDLGKRFGVALGRATNDDRGRCRRPRGGGEHLGAPRSRDRASRTPAVCVRRSLRSVRARDARCPRSSSCPRAATASRPGALADPRYRHRHPGHANNAVYWAAIESALYRLRTALRLGAAYAGCSSIAARSISTSDLVLAIAREQSETAVWFIDGGDTAAAR